MEKKIRKAIIPAAGLGTRFLPATIAREWLRPSQGPPADCAKTSGIWYYKYY